MKSTITPVIPFIVVGSLLVPSTARAQDITQLPDSDPTPSAPAEPAVISTPSVAREPGAPRFGEAGEVVLFGGDTTLGASSTHFDSSEYTHSGYRASSSLAYFVADHFSIGVYLAASLDDTKGYGADGSLVETKNTLVSGGPTLGYDLPLGEYFSFHPHVVLGVHRSHQSVSVVTGSSASIAASPSGSPDTVHTGPWINVTLPLLVHPVPHLFVGFGPSFYHDGASEIGTANVSGRRTSIGVSLEVGGWWGGRAVATSAPSSDTSGFGEQGQFVLTNELGLGGGYAWFSGTDATSGQIVFAPAIDYFVVDHVSLGGGLYYSHEEIVAFDDRHNRVDDVTESFSIAPRIGVDLPIASWLSLFAHAGVAVGTSRYSEVSAGHENSISEKVTMAFGSLHALAHVARHFMVGLGPRGSQDLERKDDYQRSNRATSVGITALVGGWL